MSSSAGFSTANRFAVLNNDQYKSTSSNDQNQTGRGSPPSQAHSQYQKEKQNGKVGNGTKAGEQVNGVGNGVKMPVPVKRDSLRQQSNGLDTGSQAGVSPRVVERPATTTSSTATTTTTTTSTEKENNDRHPTPPLKKARRRNSLRVVRMPSSDGKGETTREVVHKKTDWEIPRKTLHGSIGFLVLYLRAQNPHTILPLLKSLLTALVVITTTDVLRFNSRTFNLVYIQVCGPLMRQSEEKGWNGVIWYLVGVLVTLGVYPRDVAVVGILTLSWSDTAASTIGRLFSPISPPLPAYLPGTRIPFAARKSLAGFLAAVLTGMGIGLMYWPQGQGKRSDGGWGELWGGDVDLTVWMGERMGGWAFLKEGWGRLLTAAVLGVAGAIVEALDLGLDDNMTLPIMTGAIVWIWLTVVSALT